MSCDVLQQMLDTHVIELLAHRDGHGEISDSIPTGAFAAIVDSSRWTIFYSAPQRAKPQA